MHGFLDDQIVRYGKVKIIARRMNQDSLESLFGSLRYLCVGGQDPSAYQVHQSVQPAQEQRRARRALKRKRNSGF